MPSSDTGVEEAVEQMVERLMLRVDVAAEVARLRRAVDPETLDEATGELMRVLVPSIRQQERQRVMEAVVQHAGEWALRLRVKAEVTTDDWADLRRLLNLADAPDTDDLCTCGHVRHEHHTWNENASVGCAFCPCEQFHLDLDSLEAPDA